MTALTISRHLHLRILYLYPRRFFSTAPSNSRVSSAASPHSHSQPVLVIGAGQMGRGIAHVSALLAQRSTILIDMNVQQLDTAREFIVRLLDKAFHNQKLSAEEVQQTLSRLHYTPSLEDMVTQHRQAFVIEAATENIEIKRKIFKSLGEMGENAVLATNTSSISITKIAAAASDPSKVIGMHFMNPVPVMPLIEIIRGLQTSDATLEHTLSLAKAMHKQTSVSKDVPGFVANRVLMPYINEAIYVLFEGISSREDIDLCMKLGTNVPMGPLTLADFIGLDTCLAIMKTLQDGLGDSKYRPCPLLQQYVDAGWFGRKSGRGFYEYTPSK